MDLYIFDAYNLRARLSPSLILLSPVAISVFLCFEQVRNISATSFILIILLAFANSIPIIQRRHSNKRQSKSNNAPKMTNRAATLLSTSDITLDAILKKRYYRKLAGFDPTFSPFLTAPDDVDDNLCKSAEVYLRNRTRNNHLVLEENINYGFCKNLSENKTAGIFLSAFCFLSVVVISCLVSDTISAIPFQNYLAAILDLLVILFWIIGIKKSDLNRAADNYAKALIMAIDSLDTD